MIKLFDLKCIVAYGNQSWLETNFTRLIRVKITNRINVDTCFDIYVAMTRLIKVNLHSTTISASAHTDYFIQLLKNTVNDACSFNRGAYSTPKVPTVNHCLHFFFNKFKNKLFVWYFRLKNGHYLDYISTMSILMANCLAFGVWLLDLAFGFSTSTLHKDLKAPAALLP